MKLSVSAYRAQASAHKKILSNYQHQLSYGATNQASSARTPSDPATFLTGFKVTGNLWDPTRITLAPSEMKVRLVGLVGHDRGAQYSVSLMKADRDGPYLPKSDGSYSELPGTDKSTLGTAGPDGSNF
ncbi:hypothetical protein WH47_03786 [Habropoda laboriosa]|uniref:Uncharacterized protein n=1 Tax=Habropoda laboriosa TaxID=597456 RepID=A0A0L7QUR9_9HYME|nr:hypothetical protein WH47_03786 [Habropoda laboriosa]